MQHGHGAAGTPVQVVPLEMFEHFDVCRPIGPRDSRGGDESANGLSRKSAAAHAAEGGHAWVVPSVHNVFLHKLDQLALAEHGVRDVEPIELNLLRWEDAELLDKPAIEGLMIGKLQRAHGVGDLLDRVRLPVREVVHRIDAPRVARALVSGVQDAIHHRIAHVDVGRAPCRFWPSKRGCRRGTRRLFMRETGRDSRLRRGCGRGCPFRAP